VPVVQGGQPGLCHVRGLIQWQAFYLPSRDATIVMIVNSDIGLNGKNPIPVLFNKLSAIVTPDHASGT